MHLGAMCIPTDVQGSSVSPDSSAVRSSSLGKESTFASPHPVKNTFIHFDEHLRGGRSALTKRNLGRTQTDPWTQTDAYELPWDLLPGLEVQDQPRRSSQDSSTNCSSEPSLTPRLSSLAMAPQEETPDRWPELAQYSDQAETSALLLLPADQSSELPAEGRNRAASLPCFAQGSLLNFEHFQPSFEVESSPHSSLECMGYCSPGSSPRNAIMVSHEEPAAWWSESPQPASTELVTNPDWTSPSTYITEEHLEMQSQHSSSFSPYLDSPCSVETMPAVEMSYENQWPMTSYMVPDPVVPNVWLTDAGVMFEFSLRKDDGASLGLRMEPSPDDKTFRVECVRKGGAVDAWNAQCVGPLIVRSVLAGDTILSVNGKTTCCDMLEEISTKQLLRMAVFRCGGQSFSYGWGPGQPGSH